MNDAAAILMNGVGELANTVNTEAPLVPAAVVPAAAVPDAPGSGVMVELLPASVVAAACVLLIVVDAGPDVLFDDNLLAVASASLRGGDVVSAVLEVVVALTSLAGAVVPSSLQGMADPTPVLVQGVGIGSSEVSGLSAGLAS
jgi:hypothetical protein